MCLLFNSIFSMSLPLILIIVAVLVVGWFVVTYNVFVRLKNRVEEAWADIDVQLKRRFDLIPNLVETVKGYASHEKEVFEQVTKARSALMTAEQSGDVAGAASADNMLTGALKSLFAVAEAYPDLKANDTFGKLQMELSDTENKIQAARRFYNGNVRDFNTKLETFPSNLIAGMFGFKERDFFDLSDSPEERENVKVSF